MNFIYTELGILDPKVFKFEKSDNDQPDDIFKFKRRFAGQYLSDIWEALPLSCKEVVIKQLAASQAKIFDGRFNLIGGLCFDSFRDDTQDTSCIKLHSAKDVELIYTAGSIILSYNSGPSGPFYSTHDWLLAKLSYIIKGRERAIANAKTKGIKELKNAETIISLAKRLKELLSRIFPADEKERPFSALISSL